MTYDISDIPQAVPTEQLPTVPVYPPATPGRVLQVVLFLLSPFLYIGKQLLTITLWVYVRSQEKVMSVAAKCPACGVRSPHEIRYAEDYECVIHTCARCKAEYGLPTVVPVTRWRISRRPGKVEDDVSI